jgi:hypothetical protein
MHLWWFCGTVMQPYLTTCCYGPAPLSPWNHAPNHIASKSCRVYTSMQYQSASMMPLMDSWIHFQEEPSLKRVEPVLLYNCENWFLNLLIPRKPSSRWGFLSMLSLPAWVKKKKLIVLLSRLFRGLTILCTHLREQASQFTRPCDSSGSPPVTLGDSTRTLLGLGLEL